MVSRSIKAIYKMIVYEDGGVELKQESFECELNQTEVEVEVGTRNVSERIRQIMSVIKLVHQEVSKNNYQITNKAFMNKLVSSAYKKVAQENSVTEQTVGDKCGRQLGLTKSRFVELICDYLDVVITKDDYRKTALYELLLENVANAENDVEYMNNCFEQQKNL